jgi:hypothetical protein
MNAHVKITDAGWGAVDGNQKKGAEPSNTHTETLGIAMLVIGVGLTAFWAGFIMWLSGYMIGFW